MTLGRLVAAVAGKVQGAVGSLVGVRVDRLVGQKEAPGLGTGSLDERRRLRVQQIGDVARSGAAVTVQVELRVEELAVAVEAHPAVVTGARRAVVAHVPLAHVRRLVTQAL